MSLEYWLLYLTTVSIATLVPGPAMLLALGHGMRYGVRQSFAATAGVSVVSALQASASLAGLGAILVASQDVFHIIRWLGAAYLVYVGVQTWRSAGREERDGEGLSIAPDAGAWRRFMQGFLVALSNPKAIIFFAALYPQFIRPETANAGNFAMLVATVIVVNIACMSLYAAGGRRIVGFFANESVRRNYPRCIGATFVCFGVGLAASGE